MTNSGRTWDIHEAHREVRRAMRALLALQDRDSSSNMIAPLRAQLEEAKRRLAETKRIHGDDGGMG